MTWANEREGHDGEPKKRELLPKGDKANEIVEVLVAMFRAHNSEDAAKGGDSSEHANQRRDAGEKR